MLTTINPNIPATTNYFNVTIVLHSQWMIKCVVNGRIVPITKFILSRTTAAALVVPVPAPTLSIPQTFPAWHSDEVRWVMNMCSALIMEGVHETNVPHELETLVCEFCEYSASSLPHIFDLHRIQEGLSYFRCLCSYY